MDKPSKKRAFSLIELMVVIAIVGFLAAVAIPAYSGYQLKSKVSSVVPLMHQWNLLHLDYYALNGSYSTAYDDYGLGIDSGNVWKVNNPSNYSPYISLGSVNFYNCTSHSKPNAAQVAVVIDATAAGLPGDLMIKLITVDDNGVMKTICAVNDDSSNADSIQYAPKNCQANYVNDTGGEMCNAI